MQGTLLEAQWNGVANRIENVLNEAYETSVGFIMKGRFTYVFDFDEIVTIIVEKTTGYNFYKVVEGNFRTLYLNVNGVNNLLEIGDDDQSKIINAVFAMREEYSKTE